MSDSVVDSYNITIDLNNLSSSYSIAKTGPSSYDWTTSNDKKHHLTVKSTGSITVSVSASGAATLSFTCGAAISISNPYEKSNVWAEVREGGITKLSGSLATYPSSGGYQTLINSGTFSTTMSENGGSIIVEIDGWGNYPEGEGHHSIIQFNITVVPVEKKTATFYILNRSGNWSTYGTMSRVAGSSINLPDPTATLVAGYRWVRWRKDSSSGTSYSFGATFTLNTDTDFYVEYKQASFDIYLEHPNGNTLKFFTVTYGTSTNYNTSLPTSISGYDSCNGWYSNYGGSGSLLGTSSANGSTYWSGGIWAYDDGGSYLYFYPNVTSHITYQTQFGTAPSNQTMTYSSSAYAANAPSGYDTDTYSFLYWKNGSTTYNAGALVKSSSTYQENLTLIAVFRRMKATITYDGNGHEISQTSQTSNYSTPTNAINGSNVLGYDFKGWATTKARADAGTIDYTAGARIKAANVEPVDMTLWAVWEKVAIIVYSKQNDNKWYPGMVYYKQGNKWIVSPYGYVKIDGNWKLL